MINPCGGLIAADLRGMVSSSLVVLGMELKKKPSTAACDEVNPCTKEQSQ